MGRGVALRGSAAQAGASTTSTRSLAHEARQQLKRCVDPIDERDRIRDAGRETDAAKKAAKSREAMTLEKAALDYFDRVVDPRLTEKHAAQWISSLPHHVPASIWKKPIADIEPPELLAALSGVRTLDDKATHIPETLSRVRHRLDAIFEDAIFHRRCTANPAAAIRWKMRETMSAKKAGEFAALPYRELPSFMDSVIDTPGWN